MCTLSNSERESILTQHIYFIVYIHTYGIALKLRFKYSYLNIKAAKQIHIYGEKKNPSSQKLINYSRRYLKNNLRSVAKHLSYVSSRLSNLANNTPSFQIKRKIPVMLESSPHSTSRDKRSRVIMLPTPLPHIYK